MLEEAKGEVQVSKLQGLKKNCQLNSRNKVDFAKQRGSIALADKSFTSIKQRETSKSVRQSDSETMHTRRIAFQPRSLAEVQPPKIVKKKQHVDNKMPTLRELLEKKDFASAMTPSSRRFDDNGFF